MFRTSQQFQNLFFTLFIANYLNVSIQKNTLLLKQMKLSRKKIIIVISYFETLTQLELAREIYTCKYSAKFYSTTQQLFLYINTKRQFDIVLTPLTRSTLQNPAELVRDQMAIQSQGSRGGWGHGGSWRNELRTGLSRPRFSKQGKDRRSGLSFRV